jgi:hypothetical protein
MVVAVLAATIAACSEADTQEPAADPNALSEARDVAAQLKGDTKGTAADNPLCKLFTPKELAAYVGESLAEGENAAMGSGCIWYATDGEGDVLIQVAPKDYHSNPSLAEGYKELPGLGTEGNVSPALGGWIAATIVGDETIVASVTGKAADAGKAEALLRDVIERREK